MLAQSCPKNIDKWIFHGCLDFCWVSLGESTVNILLLTGWFPLLKLLLLSQLSILILFGNWLHPWPCCHWLPTPSCNQCLKGLDASRWATVGMFDWRLFDWRLFNNSNQTKVVRRPKKLGCSTHIMFDGKMTIVKHKINPTKSEIWLCSINSYLDFENG